ncbi:NAD(P)-dependent oxidoreductase [Bauldia sp.]|uniref:NAD(P)-dependent oxidoreductase n=1 Tax=Bauldia sp. TaxID=2575872 RepID=UPI003BAAC709
MKPKLVLDQHFRTIEELFTPDDFDKLRETCEVVGGGDRPLSAAELDASLDSMAFLVAAHPRLDRATLDRAANLKAVIEVAGTFRAGLDYEACFARGIEVLSCAPGFRQSVAEMTVGLMLAGARSIVAEHEAFRDGGEHWKGDNDGTDFTLYRQDIGFVGYGSIARECTRLLLPFAPRIRAFDPWLGASGAELEDVELVDLDTVVRQSRCLVVTASPTDENWQLIGGREIGMMPPGTLLVLVSRAHLVDFDAVLAAASAGRIRAAIDVFPHEPVPPDDPIRSTPNVILSPHRAAAVPGGRQLIGAMIAGDVADMVAGRRPSRLQRADPARIAHVVGAPAAAQRKSA